jgi:heme-degrading monooxygenase HmoA
MIRLTVLYKLKPEIDEDSFIEWRLTEHQTGINAIEGVLQTGFTRIDSAWPKDKDSPHRFMTTVDWPNMEAFEKGFYDPSVQKGLKKNLEMLQDPIFLIGEVLARQNNEAD